MLKVYLVRHTTPLIQPGYCYGQSDIAPNASFKEEYAQLQKYLPHKADAIYTSPLMRCKLLAAEMQKTINAPLFDDERLKEMNFGNWELKQWNALNQEELNNWMTDFVFAEVPQGESFLQLNNRVRDFIENVLLQPSAFKEIIISTHAGVIRCFLNFILDFPLKKAFKLKVDYASVTLLEVSENQDYDKLIFFNKT